MKILIIEQTNQAGHKKSWRITPQESPAVFGSSRLAQIISQDPTTTPIEGVFEFKNNEWMFYDLHRERIENALTCKIDDEILLKLDSSQLKILCFEKKTNVSESLDQSATAAEAQKNDSSRKPYQLFVVRHGKQVLETRVLEFSENFKSDKIENCPTMKPVQADSWNRQTVGLYEISQKTVYLKSQNDISGFSKSDLLDEDSQKNATIIISASFLIGLLALFSPKGSTDFAPPEIPKTVQRIIVRNEVRKPKSASAPIAERTPSSIPEPTQSEKTTGSKVAHLLKNIQSGRISTLIGKVSAQIAKSKNLIISGGLAAGTAQTGPALSALGPVDKSGRDWSTDAKGAGLTVNTQGKGGGKNTHSFGSLAGGKVGSGGVGLIEDESEVTGGLDRDIIAQYIKSQLGQILYCYERQLSAQPDLFGKVAIRFEIGSAGEVTSQKIGDTTLKNSSVEGCILNRVAAWKFPAPQGGTKVLVTYPFLFKSTN